MSEAPPPSGREGQLRSPFAVLLEQLCQSCSGAFGAGITDREGEAVDISMARVQTAYGSRRAINAYEVKLACAHFQIALRAAGYDDASKVQRIDIVTDDWSFTAAPLGDGYVLVHIGDPNASTRLSDRALREAVVGIAAEAGWEPPHVSAPRWKRVPVNTDGRGAPQRVAGERATAVTRLAAGGVFEKRYGIVLADGAHELVREPSGHWYLKYSRPPNAHHS